MVIIKNLTLILNSILLLGLIILRFLIFVKIDVYSLRIILTNYTWLIILVFVSSTVIGMVFRKFFNNFQYTLLTSIVGIVASYLYYDIFLPY